MYFSELPHALWTLFRDSRKSEYFWTLLWLEFKAPFRFYWNNRWRWRLLKLIPRRVKYWIVIETATKGEKGHPGEVTAMTMLDRLDPKG